VLLAALALSGAGGAEAQGTSAWWAAQRPWWVGFAAGAGPSEDGYDVQWSGVGGFDLFHDVSEEMAVGLARLGVGFGYSSIEGELLSITGTPALQLGIYPYGRLQLYAQHGIAFSLAKETDIRPRRHGIALSSAIGMRVWLSCRWTLGVQSGGEVVLSGRIRNAPARHLTGWFAATVSLRLGRARPITW